VEDIKLICKECREEFTYTIWEQKFFEKKGWSPPLRCVICRRKKKLLRIALEDGVSIKEQGAHSAVCAGCGKDFLSLLEVREGEKEYCPECWKEIKGF